MTKFLIIVSFLFMIFTDVGQAGIVGYVVKGEKILLKTKELAKFKAFFEKYNLKTDGKLFNREFGLLGKEKVSRMFVSSKLNTKLIIKALEGSLDKESFTYKNVVVKGRTFRVYYPKAIADLKQILSKSQLHKEVYLRIKNASKISVKHIDNIVGKINESIMVKFFEKDGWKRIEGEVGRNGIDGLFVKRDKHGRIIDVLVAEAKYNTSNLGKTNFGKQMSKKWLLRKIQELKKTYPDDKDYAEIEKFIKKDNYRAVVWNMNVENNRMKIIIKNVHQKGDKDIFLRKEKEILINMEKPRNSFEENMVSYYKEELNKVGTVYQ